MPGRHRIPTGRSVRVPLIVAIVIAVFVVAVVAYGLHNEVVNTAATRPRTTSSAAPPVPVRTASPSTGPASSPTGPVPSPTSPVPSPTPTVRQLHTVRPGATPPAATTPRHTLVVRWTQRAWVRVTDGSGRILLTGTRPAGTVQTYDGPRYTVQIANAGGVTVALDGGAPRPAGSVGQIAQFTVVRS